MKAAIAEIKRIGLEILDKHDVDERAGQVAKNWHLKDRQVEEQIALVRLVDTLSACMEAIAKAMSREGAKHALHEAIDELDRSLPVIEQSMLEARHAALDLLQWTQREGRIAESALPGLYRASYGQLVSYTPLLKPWLEAAQEKLLDRVHDSAPDTGAKQLLANLSRLNGILDSARGFVHAIVSPPLDLVFQETNLFLDDWNTLETGLRADVATALNDCCQCLLYDASDFEKRTTTLSATLGSGMEVSLHVLRAKGHGVLFAMNEDPLFGQLTITLYRAVDESALEGAGNTVIEMLHREITQRETDG